MTKNQMDVESIRLRLFNSAASLGTAKKAEQTAFEALQGKARERLAVARDAVAEDSKRAAGFGTPMFAGLAELGTLWAGAFNDTDSAVAQDSARGMAESFMVSFTGATDATKKGGTMSGYANTIRTGKMAERMLQALQNRLESWQAIADSVKDDNTDEGKAKRETASRYTVIPGPSLDKDGNWPTRNDKDGNPVPYPPKFNGRAACVKNGIALPHRGATDRKAMLATLAGLVLEHGESALHPDVLDAVLDNGGRFKVPANETPEAFAASARDMIEKVLLHGGTNSADAAALILAKNVLERIASEGLKPSMMADSTTPPESNPAPDASEPTPESNPAPDASEGEPVALGKPSGKRAARRRGGSL